MNKAYAVERLAKGREREMQWADALLARGYHGVGLKHDDAYQGGDPKAAIALDAWLRLAMEEVARVAAAPGGEDSRLAAPHAQPCPACHTHRQRHRHTVWCPSRLSSRPGSHLYADLCMYACHAVHHDMT